MEITTISKEELFNLFIANRLNYESYYDRKEREGPLSPIIRCIDSKKRETIFSVNESLTGKATHAATFPILIVEQNYQSSPVNHYHVLSGLRYNDHTHILIGQEFWLNDHKFVQVDEHVAGTLYLPNGGTLFPTLGKHLHILQEMKNQFFSVILKEPAYRLLSVTGLLKTPYSQKERIK